MSAIIKQTKRRYKIALSIELFIFVIVFFIVFILQKNSAISFLFGTLAAFVPYSLFVFIVFFVKQKKSNSQLMAFYKGGFVKFVCTIVLIISAFNFFKSMNYVIFFMGYFSGLLFNNLLPFMVSKYFRI